MLLTRRSLLATPLLPALWPGAAAAQDLKVLTYARTGQFVSIDPVLQLDTLSQDVIALTYSTLLTYAYLERPYKLEPDLLTQMPEVGVDKVTYTFKLRKGVRFHDNACFPGGMGRELTTDDVFYSLRRFADANLNNKSWFSLEGAVAGLDEFRAATQKAGPNGDTSKLSIAGFRKIDSHSFSIRLNKPNALFLYAFAMASAAIVPVEAVQFYKDRFGVNPVGTGPFTLKDVDRKGVLRFVKYAGYHGTYPTRGAPGDVEKGLLKDAGRKLPLVDLIEMPLIEEAQPGMLRFLKGEIDWRALDRANFTKLVQRRSDGGFQPSAEAAAKFNLYSTPGLDTIYFAINQKDPLLGRNKLLRQALAHTINTQARIDVLLNGRGVRLNSMVPLDLPGSERDTGAVGRAHDPAAARRLLAEAGYPGGKGLPPLTMMFSDSTSDTRNLFDQMKAQFASVGMQLKADYVDFPTYMKNLDGANFQIAPSSWLADYPDAENFYQLLYSKNVAPGPNHASFANAAYDKAYEASRLMSNGPERYAHFRTMNTILNEEVPVILAYNSLRFGIQQKWLSNFKRHMMTPEYVYLDIDAAAKKKGL
jgi:ABC-type transport system substrate-binding protein